MTTLVANAPARRLHAGEKVSQDVTPTASVYTFPLALEEATAPPVAYSPDGSFFLNLGAMRVGKFYPVTFFGAELVAVKDKDDSVSFYAAP